MLNVYSYFLKYLSLPRQLSKLIFGNQEFLLSSKISFQYQAEFIQYIRFQKDYFLYGYLSKINFQLFQGNYQYKEDSFHHQLFHLTSDILFIQLRFLIYFRILFIFRFVFFIRFLLINLFLRLGFYFLVKYFCFDFSFNLNQVVPDFLEKQIFLKLHHFFCSKQE